MIDLSLEGKKAGVTFFGMIFYLIFASADKQFD